MAQFLNNAINGSKEYQNFKKHIYCSVLSAVLRNIKKYLTFIVSHERQYLSAVRIGSNEASRSPSVVTMANESGCSDNVENYVPQQLTSEDKEYAAACLNETDETRENAIVEIRRWIEDELCIRIDDFLILRFLRVCKFNLEKTKVRIRNYYKQRSHLPEWYRNRDPFQSELQEMIDMGICLPLRKPDSQGRLVIMMRGTLHDPRRHQMSDIVKMSTIAIEVAMKFYPAASVYGCALLIDVANPTIRHILQFRPYILMNIVHTWQSCYPMRYQKIKIFNAPAFFDVIARILKSFMTEKIKNRFHIYSHTLDCFEDIPAEILPVEYGGTGDTMQELTEFWKKYIEENCSWLKHDDENGKIE
ncbi:retinol-binding protein pinta-like [Temnothorax longispinosus]|uniref:retinol-binding protein pinta-like n=1 Tax=Temnothorax longispinosus TaxID=300112 RepID=UPI003A9A0299